MSGILYLVLEKALKGLDIISAGLCFTVVLLCFLSSLKRKRKKNSHRMPLLLAAVNY